MVYKVRIEKGVMGRAIIMVPISESPVDTAVFNACVEAHLGHDCRNTKEIEEVYTYWNENELRILKVLNDVMIDSLKPEEMKKIEDAVIRMLEND